MKMTANRRIFLNVAATYARSIYTLGLGLVTARWLLLSLGTVDYGLFGVVGGLIAFVTYFNRLFAGAVSRFYALSIGRGKRKGCREEGLLECRRWFTVAVSVHTVVPVMLILIGYPVGAYAVENWLVIPSDRVLSCLWVWRMSCLSALVGMVNVPFRAMYTAKQEIAELTVLNVANATLNAILLYYMVSHPGDWLIRYAFWKCLLEVLPRVFICVRALIAYPECRIRRSCLWQWQDVRRLSSFVGWTAFGSLGKIVQTKGVMVLVNLCFGPAQNATVAIANRLAARTNTFAQSLITSFTPAIVSAYGSGNQMRTCGLVRRVSKLGALMVAIVSIPLLIEVHEVMRLWLKTPPVDSPFLCACVLCAMFLNKLSAGQVIALSATGRLAAYEIGVGLSNFLSILVVGGLFLSHHGLASVGWVALGLSVFNVIQRVYHSHVQVGIPWSEWAFRVALPVLGSAGAAVLSALVPHLLMSPSLGRIVLTTASCELVLLPLAWFVVIDDEERVYLKEKLKKVRRKFASGGKGART